MTGFIADGSTNSSIDVKIEHLFRREHTKLVRYLRRRTDRHEDVQDILQEAFARLLASRPSGLTERPEAYLQRVVRNVLIDRFRRNQTAPAPVPMLDDEDPALGVEPQQSWAIEAEDAMEQYRRALLELPERTREIFELNRAEALTYAEIAARYGVTVKAIEYHVSKAIHHLHQAFYGE